VAVFGSSVDVIYRARTSVWQKGMSSGAVVSGVSAGTRPPPRISHPQPHHQRLSLGVIIVEAAEYSGSLITARLATEQNRECSPAGNITAQSFAPNHLIKQGAKLVDSGRTSSKSSGGNPHATVALGRGIGRCDEARHGAALRAVASPRTRRRCLRRCAWTKRSSSTPSSVGVGPQPRVLAALLELEMSGLIRQMPEKNFIRKL